ncbi:MAG: HAD family hydrolase [Eubacteriales bacterium]|nr:HAD family hydrolase [Eubacteriales bacterium]
MKPKAIFLDIDGTLTEPGTNVPPASALEAIRKAREAGNYVFLCSGRNYGMLSPLLKYGFDGAVASAGGYIVCKDEVIYDCPMTEEQRIRIMDVLKRNGVFRTVECIDSAYADEEFKEFLREHAGQGENSELLRWREQIEKELNILPMQDYMDQPIYKVVAMSPSQEAFSACEEELKEDFSFCIQERRGGIINGESINHKFDKGTGVKRVCEHLGISLEDSVGFGDSMNDKEMLEIAGLSVCMENGNEEMKKIADVICPSVAEDGIKKAFEEYHLM